MRDMPSTSTAATLRTLDGEHLAGTLVTPAGGQAERAVVLVHGGGVTREEGGFFTRLAEGLGTAGVASLRYDLRGHGESDGIPQEITLTVHLNDIHVALEHVRQQTGAETVGLLGASFGGGLAAYYAAKRPEELTRLVLLNPQLNYKDRYIDQKSHWHGDLLADDAADEMGQQGFINHSPTVKHGRAFLNEVFWISPIGALAEIAAPTLLVHGTKDTFVPIATSRQADKLLKCEHRLVEIEDAQHGFAVHEDPQYLHSQSQAWQSFVIQAVVEWVTAAS
ncbi:MAG: alpha/beta hydrolase [Micromonosporaceae bacterium]